MTTTTENPTARFQKLWPSYSEFAADAGVTAGCAQIWRNRGYIPPGHHARIAQAGAGRGLGAGKTYSDRVVSLLQQLEELGLDEAAA